MEWLLNLWRAFVISAGFVPSRTEKPILLLAGSCAGTERGVPHGPPIQESMGENFFPDRGEHDKALVTVSHFPLTGLRALRLRR